VVDGGSIRKSPLPAPQAERRKMAKTKKGRKYLRGTSISATAINLAGGTKLKRPKNGKKSLLHERQKL